MLLYKATPQNGCVLIQDTEAREFNSIGRCINLSKTTIPLTYGATPVKVLSLLNSTNYTEAAVFGQESMEKFYTDKTFPVILSAITESHGYIRMIRDRDQYDGVRYCQVLFIYPEMVDVNQIVNSLGFRRF